MMHEEDFNWELIMHRLNSIADNQKESSDKLTVIEEKLTKLETMKHSVDELKKFKEEFYSVISFNELRDMREWKQKTDEIISPTQLKKTLEEFDKVKTFKTQALMVWIVVQAAMVVLIFLEKFFL